MSNPAFAKLTAGSGEPVPKPHYDSADYLEFVQCEKAKGLLRRYWKDLPKMWEDELEFRASFERALCKFSEGKV